MDKLSDFPLDQVAYRQLTNHSWEPKTGKLKSNVFTLRSHEDSLSVFRADRRTPREVLERCLELQREKLASGDEEARQNAEYFFQQFGDTVESLVEHDWRVAAIAIAAFTSRGFGIDDPDELGHQNVSGAREEFKRYARELNAAATLLSREDCLEK